MFYLFALIAFAGWAIFLLSEIMYIRRTRDNKIRQKIWLSKNILTEQEYILNRVGLAMALLGLVLMFGSEVISK